MRVRIIRIEIKCCASYQDPPNAQYFQAAHKGIRPRLARPAGACAAFDIR
ncbi:50S ribosomal protein L40 [Burkholderia seminalis]|nr:50S ribosomal protein L40 [Burkholderia seminalis]